MDGERLDDLTVVDLLRRHAAIQRELRRRGVSRTGNAPLGDYAEYLAARVYGGELAANSAKSHDLVAEDGRRVQVKARRHDTRPGAVFSVFRSFAFDIAVLMSVHSTTYDVLWAREVSPAEIRAAARYSEHVNAYRVGFVAGGRLGVDVTARFHAVLSEGVVGG